jgi:hypothetical protein
VIGTSVPPLNLNTDELSVQTILAEDDRLLATGWSMSSSDCVIAYGYFGTGRAAVAGRLPIAIDPTCYLVQDWTERRFRKISRKKGTFLHFPRITNIYMNSASGSSVIEQSSALRLIWSKKLRLRRLWDREKVIEEIRGLRDRNLPLYTKYVMGLFSLARAATSNLGAARSVLPELSSAQERISGRLTILRTLRDALKKGSKKDLSRTLMVEAGYCSESLRNAQRALKNDPKTEAWLEQGKIIALLSRMHRSGDRMAYASARREFPALVSAAE